MCLHEDITTTAFCFTHPPPPSPTPATSSPHPHPLPYVFSLVSLRRWWVELSLPSPSYSPHLYLLLLFSGLPAGYLGWWLGRWRWMRGLAYSCRVLHFALHFAVNSIVTYTYTPFLFAHTFYLCRIHCRLVRGYNKNEQDKTTRRHNIMASKARIKQRDVRVAMRQD